ncbi:MAG: hypothetical protein HOP11_07910 [Saprospiraceae bacterium]|nr:hypothetical protein [Saprospiraceae bacterium]
MLMLIYCHNLIGQTVSGKIRGVHNNSAGDTLGCCTPLVIADSGKCQVLVKKYDYGTGVTVNSNVTTNTGLYTATAAYPSRIRLVPRQNDIANDTNGVNVNDVQVLNNHINRVKKIICPFKRIAADATNNGKLDTFDRNAINNRITGTAWAAPNWRFIPRVYVDKDTCKQYDPDFYRDFWNPSYTDNNGNQYPFLAIKTYKDINNAIQKYSYVGNNGFPRRWVDTLQEWNITTNNNAMAILWDFYAVKTGDLTNIGGKARFCGNSNSLKDPSNKYKILDKKVARSKSYSKVTIRLMASSPISAFQLSVHADPTKMRWKRNTIEASYTMSNFYIEGNTGTTANNDLIFAYVNHSGENMQFSRILNIASIEIDPISSVIDPQIDCYLDESEIRMCAFNSALEEVPVFLELVFE